MSGIRTVEPTGKKRVLLVVLSIAAASVAFASLSGARTQSGAGASDGSPTPKQDSPFACNLSALNPKSRKRHFDELGPALRARNKSIREETDGFGFEFPWDQATLQLLTEWAAGEHLCCPFFDIDVRLEREGGPLWLHLSGREGVKRFIRADFAPWFQR